MEYILAILLLVVVVGVPLTALVLAIIALVRSGRLARRVAQLEAERRAATAPAPAPPPEVIAEVVEPEAMPAARIPFPPTVPAPARPPIQWELLIGGRALGWIAVVALFFAAAFFLRYAIERGWLGPLGRVSLGAAGGVALLVGGAYYHRRGWEIFSRMLTTAGIVLLYLITYAAFGRYRLLPQEAAGVFLAVIVIQSAILALRYDSLTIALTAILGGLLTPVLLQSEHDQYPALFTYLAVLNLGVVLLMLVRDWRVIGTVALIGTQAIFWGWYAGNYHPEKLHWALGFQAVIFLLYLGHNLGVHLQPKRRVHWEELLRLVLAAAFWFAAVYGLLRPDYGRWLGVAAVGMAILYAVVARAMLAVRPRETGQVLAALAVAVGFIALAFPIQADAAWVALGWAAEGAALWWFGLRIGRGSLRALAGGLAAAAVGRLLLMDLFPGVREPFIPVLNDFALPALGVPLALLVGVVAAKAYLPKLAQPERWLVGAAGVIAVLLLWLIVSVDIDDYHEAWAAVDSARATAWLWTGTMILSIFWAVYATAILVAGFRLRQAWLRWTAFGLYGLTIGKVFLLDMAELEQVYRVLAFFVLAAFLGSAAWAYQRFKPDDAAKAGGIHE